MKNLMNILRLAVDKDFPVYSQYLHSTGKRLQTKSRDNTVDIEAEMPFVGCVKFSVLDSICKMSEHVEFQVVDDFLQVSYGDATAQINIDDVGVPKLPELSADFIDLDEETVNVIKLAAKFLGRGLYSYICMTNEAIFATDKTRLFFHQFSGVGVENYIAINAKIASLLDPSYRIGMNNNSTIVDLGIGKVEFSMDDLSDYPHKNIWEYVDRSAQDAIGICQSEELLSAVRKVTPVIVDDTEQVVKLSNKDNTLEVSALSDDVGSSSVILPSLSDEELTLKIGVNVIASLSKGYDVAFAKDDNGVVNRIYATSEVNKSEIILMGYSE